MTSSLKNKILKGAQEAVERNLTTLNRKNYDKIVDWGLEVGLQQGKDGILASVRESKDPIRDCALGAVNLVQVLRVQGQGTMPEQAFAPGAFVLMLYALDFAANIRVVKVDMPAFTRATHIYTNQVFKMFGVKPQKLVDMANQTYDVMDHPGKFELVQRHAGTVRDPMASVPVDVSMIAPRNRAERRRAGRR